MTLAQIVFTIRKCTLNWVANRNTRTEKVILCISQKRKNWLKLPTAGGRGGFFWNCELDGNITKALNLAFDEETRSSGN